MAVFLIWQAHLFRVPLAGGAVERITSGVGTHAVQLSRGFDKFVDRYHSASQPVVVRLCSLVDGSVLRLLHDCSTEPHLVRLTAEPSVVTLTLDTCSPKSCVLYPLTLDTCSPKSCALYRAPVRQRLISVSAAFLIRQSS